ncbi:MAG: hypothetical protein GX559_00790 [Candidatus Pacebacteria bacterium]|nr:hypothetical protein [Candidatus Paceibacterota bacterium]
MSKKSLQSSSLAAFTLIEILVTVSITALIMLGMTSLFISFVMSASKSRMSQSVRESGTVAMQKIIEELRNAKNINIAAAQCNGTIQLATLSFKKTNADNAEISGKFSSSGISNKRILFTEGTNDYFLTGDNHYLSNLTFVCHGGAMPKYIEIKFTLATSAIAANNPNQSKLDFKSGVTLRN